MKAWWLEAALALVLAGAVVVSGLVVVEAKHESRQQFAELQELEREADRLQVDWGRLTLEQSAFATHGRIESLARGELELVEPRLDQLKVVERAP
jgi:cell division protein FtsL